MATDTTYEPTRVLVLDTPSPLPCRSGVVVSSEHPMLVVELDHCHGWVLCKPSELVDDTLPQWVPEWLRLWLYRARRGWRKYREQRGTK